MKALGKGTGSGKTTVRKAEPCHLTEELACKKVVKELLTAHRTLGIDIIQGMMETSPSSKDPSSLAKPPPLAAAVASFLFLCPLHLPGLGLHPDPHHFLHLWNFGKLTPAPISWW